ncbi:hypothetical protein Tco_0925475 [Tanacetum coccineum]|uniref:Uncharacterized protein n=1 Tax=Tanacetum coccineum TaxID=301880 RepID=A0ABQ5D9W8_9ASTR
MARKCTPSKRPRNTAWFKEKLMLVEAQEAGQILDEEQLTFLADLGIDEAPVPYFDLYTNDMLNQDEQEMMYFEQTHFVDFLDNEINNDSNIISYSQYLQETQNAGIQDTNSSASNDLLVLSLFKQMTDQVANLDKENQTNKMVNESLTAELERYKEYLGAYTSDCDDLSSSKVVLMANLSSYDSDVLLKVPYFDLYTNDMLNQDEQEMIFSVGDLLGLKDFKMILRVTTAQLQLLSDYYCWKDYADRDEIKD